MSQKQSSKLHIGNVDEPGKVADEKLAVEPKIVAKLRRVVGYVARLAGV